MNDKRLRIAIIIGFIVVSALIVGVIALITSTSNSQSEQPAQTERIDPASGETVQDTEGKTPEKYGVNPNQPIFLGFFELLDRGMLLSEVDIAKGFLNDYANKQLQEGKPKINEMSIDVDTLEHTIDRTTYDETFRMVLTVNQEQQFVFTVVTNADTQKRTLSLLQNDVIVYSVEQDIQ